MTLTLSIYMYCYRHPDRPAVALCQDCGRALCHECESFFQANICPECNLRRIRAEKSEIYKEAMISLLAGCVGYALLSAMGLSEVLDSEKGTTAVFFSVLVFYSFFSIPSGWRILSGITPRVVLIMPILGWVLYFLFKLSLASAIGPYVLPFRLYRKIKRYREIRKTEQSISRVLHCIR